MEISNSRISIYNQINILHDLKLPRLKILMVLVLILLKSKITSKVIKILSLVFFYKQPDEVYLTAVISKSKT